MYTRLIYLISFVLALSLVGQVQAVSFVDTGDGLWSNPANWDTGMLPTAADWVKISQASDDVVNCTISEGFDAVADRVHVGYQGGDKTLTVDGGTLVISGDDLRVGKECTGILNMISGSIDIARDLDICDNAGTGLVNMFGGTINVADDLELPNVADANNGTLHMIGGTINITDNFDMLEPGPAVVQLYGGTINVGDDLQLDDPGEFDIGGGTLIVDGDAASTIQGFIDNGWITAYKEYGGGDLLLDYDLSNPGQTTLKALHALNPTPTDSGLVPAGQVKLEWILPDPCTPGDPVPVDVYFTDDYWALKNFNDPASIREVTKQDNVTSHTVTAVGNTTYYWAVDTYLGGDDPNNNPRLSPIFSFQVGNAAPTVEISADPPAAWLPDGNVVNLDATVTDDATPPAQITKTWEVIAEPNEGTATIASPTAEDTIVTFTELGVYTLRLTADDGEDADNIGTRSIAIEVFNNSCEAAGSLPGFVPIPGDVNGDCKADFLDMATVAAGWLECNALDCDQ